MENIVSSNRLHFIDWLRVIAFLSLIVFHSSVPFIKDYHWEINNESTSDWITRIVWWLHQWRLPLLFFISGVGVRFSLKRRSISKFVGERFIRLFIPLVFAMFFITPFQVYFEWMESGRINQSFSSFYPQVFEMIPYPDGILTWSHMWFVAYLFVFTIILLPLFSLSKIHSLNEIKHRLENIIVHPIFLLGLSSVFIYYIIALFVNWPEQGSLISDWYVFLSSITYYFFGFILSSFEKFWKSCFTHRRIFAMISLILAVFLFINYFWEWSLLRPQEDNLQLYIFSLNGLHIWSIILTSIGYSIKYLNFENKSLTYLNNAVYPFYILHQTIIVSSGYYILRWQIPIGIKLALILVICITTIWILYHFVIRKTILTRILFGMKY